MIKKIPMKEYRDNEALANSDLQIFKNNPSSYIWSKTAPRDPKKANTADIGTATHAATLEPETLDDEVFVTDIKGRKTKAFEALQAEHSDKIVLTEEEINHVKMMALSANCDPMFKSLLDADGMPEASIFVTDPITGLDLKIRPDKVVYLPDDKVLLADVKTTASLDEWRSEKTWVNPLFKFNYGFTAAYYLHVGSIHYNYELTEYVFPVIQKSSSFGSYPASVFTISKDELIRYGFWDDMIDTLARFAECKASGNWVTTENFPEFYIQNDESFDLDNVEVIDA